MAGLTGSSRLRNGEKEEISRRVALPPQQASLQQCLHVAPSVGDQQDEYLTCGNPVNQPIGAQQHLPEFTNAESLEFLGHAAPQWIAFERADLVQKGVEQGIGIGGRAVFCEVPVDRFEIVLRALRQLYGEAPR